jgi:hypothetical protein
MDWTEIIFKVFELCIIPLLGILTSYLVKWLKAKETEIIDRTDSEIADKYIAMVA